MQITIIIKPPLGKDVKLIVGTLLVQGAAAAAAVGGEVISTEEDSGLNI